jgi:hypothetical protein
MVYTWYIHGILYTPSGGWCCGGGRARGRAPTHLRGSAYILSRRHGHARAHARTSARQRTPERAPASTLRYSGFRARIPPTQKLQTKSINGEGRGAARLHTCGAAPTYCHAGTATRAHTRARLHVRAHPSARPPCGISAPCGKSDCEKIPELLNDRSKLCMPAVPTILILLKIPREQEKNVCAVHTAHKRTVVPNTLMRALLIQ